MTRALADENQAKAAVWVHPLRLAVTGETVSPGLFELMSVLGKESCYERVQRFIDQVFE